jgi:hypothetical protein
MCEYISMFFFCGSSIQEGQAPAWLPFSIRPYPASLQLAIPNIYFTRCTVNVRYGLVVGCQYKALLLIQCCCDYVQRYATVQVKAIILLEYKEPYCYRRKQKQFRK